MGVTVAQVVEKQGHQGLNKSFKFEPWFMSSSFPSHKNQSNSKTSYILQSEPKGAKIELRKFKASKLSVLKTN